MILSDYAGHAAKIYAPPGTIVNDQATTDALLVSGTLVYTAQGDAFPLAVALDAPLYPPDLDVFNELLR